jgi:periplasmic copper chaperone A
MNRLAVLAAAGLALGACGSADDVNIANAWSRANVPGQTSGAVYFDVTVETDDTLVGASVPATIAARAEVHEVVAADGEMSDDMEMSEGSHDMGMDTDTGTGTGEVLMREVPDGLALTGGQTISFEPGSYHVMLADLVEPLAVGDEFELTLRFAEADDVIVDIEVAESAP